jgi:hypothetical protein
MSLERLPWMSQYLTGRRAYNFVGWQQLHASITAIMCQSAIGVYNNMLKRPGVHFISDNIASKSGATALQ